ncbi:MAG: type II toxin-antitoxin system HicB family antitoxin [Acidobacteriia bacterium]|nr:type II toxin-antitoxin system HicB family antitoxin [Terriglobia bacterium]
MSPSGRDTNPPTSPLASPARERAGARSRSSGCVAAAATLEETREVMREAIEFHIEGMRIDGDAIPEPTPHIEQIEVSA